MATMLAATGRLSTPGRRAPDPAATIRAVPYAAAER
jgi:hypothetical protein